MSKINLFLAIFYETTTAAAKSYYPHRSDISNFLNIFKT